MNCLRALLRGIIQSCPETFFHIFTHQSLEHAIISSLLHHVFTACKWAAPTKAFIIPLNKQYNKQNEAIIDTTCCFDPTTFLEQPCAWIL
jgi:hypothetical protein